MSRSCISLFILLLCSAGLQAQTKIFGRVLLEDDRPASQATVSLLRQKDSSTLKLAIPDDKGGYEFDNLLAGRYLIAVSFTGYQKFYSSELLVDGIALTKEITDIRLQVQPSSLNEVTVQARKPFLERKLDRLVMNVENSIVNTGTTALEVLEKAPGVLINQENGINLKGKSGVTIMIDGKPSPLSGSDLITYLKGMPSGNIERIEIITNPSARYDAQGNAGIIDIRFKKDKREGYNGSLTAGFGQGVYAKPSGSLSLNYRRKKWNVFTSQAMNAPKSFTNFYINRKFFAGGNGPVESVFDQNTFTRQPQKSWNSRVGVDYYLGSRTVIGLLFNGTFYQGKRDGLSVADIDNAQGDLQFNNITSNLVNDKRYNILTNLNFKHTFDSTGRELNIDADLGRFKARPRQDIYINTYDATGSPLNQEQQKSDQQSAIYVKSFKADYVHPLRKGIRFEAGLKTSFIKTDNDLKFFKVENGTEQPDLNRSNHFIYTENVNAAYINYSQEFAKGSIQAGLRMEHTHSSGDQLTTGQNLNRNYVQLFPSIFLNRKLGANHELGLSYSRRIDRPTYRQLNPFKLLVDNYTYVTGDPFLYPVLTNSYQLSYTLQSKYNATLSYLKSRKTITDVFVQDDVTKISTQIPANLQDFVQYDLAVNIPLTIGNWMNTNINASVYYNHYKSSLLGGQLDLDFVSWDITMNNSFILGKKGWSAEMSSFYQSKNVWGQFIIRDLAQVTAGIQKISRNKKSTFKLSVSDIFKTNHIAVIVQYLNQDWHTDRTWDSRYVTFTYTYRFGKNTVARARQRNTGVEDEKRRAN